MTKSFRHVLIREFWPVGGALILLFAVILFLPTAIRANSTVTIIGQVSRVTLFPGYGTGMWIVPTSTWVHFSDNRSLIIPGQFLDWLEIGKIYQFAFSHSGGVTDILVYVECIEVVVITTTTTV